jgi:outer membrane lipoprotein carrier protein
VVSYRSVRQRLGIMALFLTLATVGPGAQVTSDDPTALARALQQHYETVRDFTADFVHTYQGGVLRKTVTERGNLRVKKPGLMRWTYTAPDEKVFISDGRKMYSYIPADRQVYVSTVPQDGHASTPALFLAGKGNLLRDFTVTGAPLPKGAPPGSDALRLVPKQPERDYDWLTLVVDGGSLVLRMLVTEDQQGGLSTFTFTNLRENAGVQEKDFVFKMPRGVDVVTDTPR